MTGYTDDADVERRHAQASRNLTYVGVLLVVSGVISVVQGAIALADDTFFTVTRQSAFDFDPETWGWVQLVSGVVVMATGVAALRRAPWARRAAVVLALLSMAANLVFFPGQVFGSMLVIAVDGLIIGAVTAPGAFDRRPLVK